MNIRDTVIQIVATELEADPGSITESISFVDDLGADSPHLLEIALAIEEQFGVKVPDAELASFRTVGDVVAYVQRNVSAAAQSTPGVPGRSA
jgi:acyl carrier protein